MEYIQGDTLDQYLKAFEGHSALSPLDPRLKAFDSHSEKQRAEQIAGKAVTILRKALFFISDKMAVAGWGKGPRLSNPRACMSEPISIQDYMREFVQLHVASPKLEQILVDLVSEKPLELEHGNLREDNIIITKEDEVVLIDWEYAGYYFEGYEAINLLVEQMRRDSLWCAASLKKMDVPPETVKLGQYFKALFNYGYPHQNPLQRRLARADAWDQIQRIAGEDLGDPMGSVDYERLHRVHLEWPSWRELIPPTKGQSDRQSA